MKLSIIVPIYNAEKYIVQLGQSLIKQIDNDVEVIFVDDGSTDHSCQLLSKLIDDSDRIKLIKQNNSGASSARNTGIDYAQGEYIAFIDSDDTIAEDYVIKLLSLIRYGYDIFQLDWTSYSITGNYKKESVGLPYGKCDMNTYSTCVVLQRTNPPWNKLYRREIISKNNIRFNTNMTVGEDLAFTLNFLTYTRTVYISNYNIYNYYDNPIGVCSKVNPLYFYDNAIMYKLLIDFNGMLFKNNSLIDEINLSTLRSAFRTIGYCKMKGYNNEPIADAFVKSGLYDVIVSLSFHEIQDKIRKYLIKHKAYNIILFLTRKRENYGSN